MDNGYYKLSRRQRIGFSAGDLAQNLIYQTVSIWLLFFYTNVYGLIPAVLFIIAFFVIGRYELSDERMDEINMEITDR